MFIIFLSLHANRALLVNVEISCRTDRKMRPNTYPLVFVLLLPATLPAANGSSDHIWNRLSATAFGCDINRTEYWQFINWYFSRSLVVNVVDLGQSEESIKNADTLSAVILRRNERECSRK